MFKRAHLFLFFALFSSVAIHSGFTFAIPKCIPFQKFKIVNRIKSTLRLSGGKVTESDAYTLYISDMCPYAQRSWITANEIGISFNLEPMQLGVDNKQDWYLAINPSGKVPAVVSGGDVVYESLVVNEYLVEKYGSKLMPDCPAEKAKIRMIIAIYADALNKAFFTYISNKVPGEEEEKKNAFVGQLEKVNQLIEENDSNSWMVGQDMTLADVAFYPFFERMYAVLPEFKGWSIDDLQYDALTSWYLSMGSKESVSCTKKDPEVFVSVYKRFVDMDYFKKVNHTNEKQ